MKICVTGLGTIGLPTASILAAAGHAVLGVDIDPQRIAEIERGEVGRTEADLDALVQRTIQDGSLRLSVRPEAADIYLVAVATLLKKDNRPDLSRLDAAIEAIREHLKPDNLILIESTCPIGTTERIAQRVRSSCPSVRVAYCPERVLPGNILYELVHNDRVIGGVDEASTQQAAAFYRSFVRGEVLITDATTAETVKLAENSYRDTNIAFANELSMIADQVGVNVHEVIHLANRHPRVDILSPGVGVGGYCLSVNSWFLIEAARGCARLTEQVRGVNTEKTAWVIQKIREALVESGSRSVACLGLTYKPNVSDMRYSPALQIVETLEKEFEVLRVDPHVSGAATLAEALARAGVVALLTPHRAFAAIPKEMLRGKKILDFAGGLG